MSSSYLNLFCISLYLLLGVLFVFSFSQEQLYTILFYLAIISISVLFAYNSNSTSIAASLLFLSLILGLRNISGVDDPAYLRIFQSVSEEGVFSVFRTSTREPGYLILNRFCSLLSSNYFVFQYFTSFIPLYILHLSFKKYKGFISIPLSILLFIALYYFQMLSISLMRMFIAISIVFYSLDYIWRENVKKYCLLIFIASLFHYSSLFMLLFVPVAINNKWFIKNSGFFILIVAILYPIMGFLVIKLIPIILGERYQSYSYINTFGLSISSISFIPFLVYSYWRRKIIPKSYKPVYNLLLVMLFLSSLITLFSSLFSFGRLVFYLNLSFLLILPMNFKFEKSILFKVLSFSMIVLFSFLYLYVTQFTNSLNSETLFPYKNIFFTI